MSYPSIDLQAYRISPKTGFLPEKPIDVRPVRNLAWHELACQLPKVLLTGHLKTLVEQLPPFVSDDDTPIEISMRALSYIGHAYLWGNPIDVPHRLPRVLAQAWQLAATQVGRPPILSYPSYCLYNFRAVNPDLPFHLGNIEIAQNFLGGADEDWFILIHVDIEARAARAIRAIPNLVEAARQHQLEGLVNGLREVEAGLHGMNATMLRMPDYCDPYIYYTRVRPYIFGTKNNPSLPDGLIYEGCFDEKPQFYRGETGAQSAIVPTLDGLLGIVHKNDPLKEYLMEMREYMIPAHRLFIEVVESCSEVRQRVEEQGNDTLTTVYNECVNELYNFRAKHLEYAASYIHKQARQENNSTVVGTGGTPFMEYLAKHRDETRIAISDQKEIGEVGISRKK